MKTVLRGSAIGIVVFAAAAVALGEVDVTPLPDGSIWSAVVTFITSLQNTTVVGVVAGIVELGVVLFRTSIGSSLAGIYTLAVLYGLSAVAFLLHGLAAGTPVLQILTNAVFTGALVNSANEVIKHLFPKK